MHDITLEVQVIQGFKDAETQEQKEPGDVLEMTPERYAEAVANLSKWPGKFLEVIGATDLSGTTEPKTPIAPPKEPEALTEGVATAEPETAEAKGRGKKKE